MSILLLFGLPKSHIDRLLLPTLVILLWRCCSLLMQLLSDCTSAQVILYGEVLLAWPGCTNQMFAGLGAYLFTEFWQSTSQQPDLASKNCKTDISFFTLDSIRGQNKRSIDSLWYMNPFWGGVCTQGEGYIPKRRGLSWQPFIRSCEGRGAWTCTHMSPHGDGPWNI